MYIDSLAKEGMKYGCIKIVPPASFKPPLAFNINDDTKLPTRYQVLQKLSQGVPFAQNNKGHTFEEFNQMAEIREKEDNFDWSDDKIVY